MAFDCILFSSEDMEDQYREKHIRKIWGSTMQYEIKFREVPNSIFIVIRSTAGEALYNEIIRFAKEKLNIDLKALLDSNSSRT